MSARISENGWTWKRAAAAGMLLAVLAPFVILSFYAHPQGDDFHMVNTVAKLGFWGAQVHWYTEWQGRFFSAALLSANPLLFRSIALYKLIPAILIVLMAHALSQLLKTFAPELSGWDRICAALAVVGLYLWQMPSPAEGIYWYTGAMTYVFPCVLLIYLCGALKINWWAARVAMGLLALAICGSSETTMMALVALSIGVLLSSVAYPELRKTAGVLLGFAVIGALAVVLAPGNHVRLGYFPHEHSFGKAVFADLVSAARYCVQWMVSLPLAAATLAALCMGKRAKTESISKIHPLLALGFLFVIVASGLFPSIWVIQGAPPQRALNTVYFVFLTGWLANAYYAGSYFPGVPGFASIAMLAAALLVQGGNLRPAWDDLLSGRAARYDRQLKETYKRITECRETPCVVPPLEDPPATLFFDDLKPDPEDWRNESVAFYFGKKDVISR